ncbi:MAG: decaprenyl-phosphate phosphoribosyltransferase [Vicinamibacterales bacterium]
MAHSTSPTVTDDVERAEPNRQGRALAGAPRRSLAVGLLVSLRPTQWTKNLFVFFGLIFGQRLFVPRDFARATAAFAIFCALSGVVYLVNDVSDRDADRLHPLKRFRPIPSGEVSIGAAIGTAVLLTVVALACGWVLSPMFALVAVSYVALQTLYSGPLKHIVIVDVLTISVGFVLRAVAGAVVIDVPISQWLLILTILLALFLALSKRRHELVLLADGATGHRPILEEYSPYLLDQMIAVVTASTLISYVMYTVSQETVDKFHTRYLSLTLVFPLYGIFRYLYLVHKKEGGGNPADMLLTDRPLLACVALWGVAVALIIYGAHAHILGLGA